MSAEVAGLTQALGEAAVEIRVWKKSAEGRSGPFEDLEVIRLDAGMSASRFCELIDMSGRSWRRRQAKARSSCPPKGPWPRPARTSARDLVVKHGHRVSQATVLRLLLDGGLILPAHYQRQRRQLAERRKAAFAKEPTGPNQVWQLDFSEYETITGGIWRIASCRDYLPKYGFDVHASPIANMHDAVTAVEKALAEAELFLGHPSSMTPSSTTAAHSAYSPSKHSSPATPSCASRAPECEHPGRTGHANADAESGCSARISTTNSNSSSRSRPTGPTTTTSAPRSNRLEPPRRHPRRSHHT